MKRLRWSPGDARLIFPEETLWQRIRLMTQITYVTETTAVRNQIVSSKRCSRFVNLWLRLQCTANS